MQPVNFEGFTSWPLIRRTPPASDKQLQIEISMRRTSPQSFIWIHLHTSSINMSSIQTLKPTQKPSTRSSETETSSGSHEAVLPNHSLIGHISREGETSEEPDTSSEISCQGWLGVQEKSVSILPKKCVCVCVRVVCVQYSIYDTVELRILSRMMNCYTDTSIISARATMLHILVPPLTHREFAGPILDSCNHQRIERNGVTILNMM